MKGAGLKCKQAAAVRQCQRAFRIVAAITALPVIATVAIVQTSSRPSFEHRKFEQDGWARIPVLDWMSVEDLYERTTSSAPAQDVSIAGYMLLLPRSNERLTRFLLVPDCGNWLHPPHLFDPAEVIVVQINGYSKTPIIERRAYLVTGRLTRQSIKADSAEAGFLMLARTVEPWP